MAAPARDCALSARAHDRSERFQIPQALYGRDAEIAQLLTAFERLVASGRSELILVAGYAGIGKSALVNELHKPITRAYGAFIVGKVDQYKRDIPYTSISAAFGGLVQEILAQSDDRVTGWRERLRAALGINGQLMVSLIPQLELIIGPQPAVADLPLIESQNRFHRVFHTFMALFTQPDHPMVLFMDDLQWLDSASLDLLTYLFTVSDARHWLVIGAYRDNEVDPGHPLRRLFSALAAAGTASETIRLEPLAPAHLGRLVGDTLHCSAEHAAALIETIAAKTLGNPFFSIQFLTVLHRQGLITFDADTECWVWDLDAIQAQNFTDNVVELMIGELQLLPAATQVALQRGACPANNAHVAAQGPGALGP